MAVKKIEELNIHRDVNSTEQFDVQGYLNENWDKMQDVVDNNAEELMQVQKDISTLKEDNKTNKSSIDVLEKSNETRDGKISKNAEDIEAIQGSIKTAIETINKKDNEQDEDIKANKESIKEIQAENERLREDIKSIATIGEASGENIHLEDSSEARCEIKICGNHQQETREGYNQLKNEGTTQTLNNVTITKKEDETLVVNGTATEDFTFSIKRNIELEDGEQYKLSGCPNGGAEKKYALTINQYYENQSHFGQDYGDGVDFTYNGSLPINNNIYIRLFKGITYNNLIFKPMIVKGTEQKPYEQYGASPSFAYPSSVKAVGDVKNILNMSNAKGGTSGGITCNMIADGSYTYKGTASSKAINIWLLGSYNNKTSIFRLEPGTYYIDGVVLFDGKNVLANPDTAKIFTFINAPDITGVRTLDAVLENTYDETKYPIIAEIDHKIPWVPYNYGSVQVNIQNKNYLGDIVKGSVTENGIIATYDGEKFLCKGTTTSGFFGVSKRTNIYLPIGTYTFSQNAISFGRFVLRLYYRDNTFSTHYISTATWRVSFTTSKEAVSFGIFCDSLSSGINIDYTVYVQLKSGKTNTDWIKPEIQQRISPVQQPMFEGDTFVKQDAKWCEKHNWKTMSFDGQNVASQAGGTFADFKENGNIVRTFEIKDLLISSVRNDIFCDKLPRQADSMWNGKSTGIQSWQGKNKILISLPFDDVEKKYGQKLTVDNYVTAFYMYLQDEVLIISYPLAEPILLECTEAQSKVLDEIYNKAHTYKNITNISAESSEVNPIINVKYLKDTETEHNKLQAQINEIKELLSSTETSALLVNNLEKDLRMEVE